MSIVQDYLELTKKYQAEYGDKTIVLMEVGSFFEVYALINPNGNYTGTSGTGTSGTGTSGTGTSGTGTSAAAMYIGSHIEAFAKINEMVIAKKSNVSVNSCQVVMAGMGTANADKYIQKLQEHDYTVVIYKQDSVNKTKRNLSEIISPGTYFPNENDAVKLTNNVMCIWLQKSKATKTMPCQMTIGLANIDIFTGKTALFQFQTTYSQSPANYDELERYISAYRPSECLLVANLATALLDEIIGFIGLEYSKLHKLSSSDAVATNAVAATNKMAACVKNAEKQIYQMDIFKKFFPHLSSFPEMFPTHSIAIQAFCLLLDFVDQHNPNLVRKLTEPVFENYTDRLILANHSLSQLNIIDDERHTGRLRSVSALLNNCLTNMGQRQFMYNLHYPITHRSTLQTSYALTEHFLNQADTFVSTIRTKLSSISDLEKFARKAVANKIQPKNLSAFAEDLSNIETLYTTLQEDRALNTYLQTVLPRDIAIASACREIRGDLQRVFNLELCSNLSEIEDSPCIINRGISENMDMLLKNSLDGFDKLSTIANYLSALIQQSEKKPAQYVKIHETAKSQATLVCTNRRVALLKAALEKQALAKQTLEKQALAKQTLEKQALAKQTLAKQTLALVQLTYQSKFSGTAETFQFDIAALEYNAAGNSKTEMVITSKQIREISSDNEENKAKLGKEMNSVFQNYIQEFAKFEPALAAIIKYTTEMDLLQGKAYTARKYNYCKPILDEKADKAYFSFTGIRHPLIEHLQTNELYVANDLALGNTSPATANANGILLYGTNAVGKTSFIKSVGIAIIMAQAGLYVPCHSFTYSPYRNMFTRILGNDNLFKGLSTFAVEMTELRTILTLADAHSLVLGDELCSGTESDSALSIFTAGLEILHACDSTFLFATHFHEINKYEEITQLTKMKMYHMAVHYNQETQVLVYDRKLREGPGESMYGLEVCKSLNLPAAFLQRAHEIRMKYRPEKQNVLSLSPTHFNAKKLVGNCEVCEKHKASEVHHLQPQKKASPKNDYIVQGGQSFHKNHVANLLNICEGCHKIIHKTNAEHKVVKTSEGYMLAKL
jgi:DNA mismatch repair protein MutS